MHARTQTQRHTHAHTVLELTKQEKVGTLLCSFLALTEVGVSMGAERPGMGRGMLLAAAGAAPALEQTGTRACDDSQW